ncbi:MAG: helix-turn-helix transcriptional regulator [Verrucomicrobia bacterium]|nr:helix-turn-helix transcriptional regulator [Verrucomicrobiota bacterium]
MRETPVFTGVFVFLYRSILNFFDGLRALRMKQGAEEYEAVKTQNQDPPSMRDARRRRGWTQFDLARSVGCSESQIAKIETGRATPDRWLKEAIARELNIRTWEVGAVSSHLPTPSPTHE